MGIVQTHLEDDATGGMCRVKEGGRRVWVRTGRRLELLFMEMVHPGGEQTGPGQGTRRPADVPVQALMGEATAPWTPLKARAQSPQRRQSRGPQGDGETGSFGLQTDS